MAELKFGKKPDFKGIARYIKQKRNEQAYKLALEIILDNTGRIARSIAFDGAAQKQNTQATRDRKIRVQASNHGIPLLETGMLSNPFHYFINGQSAMSARPGQLPITIGLPTARVKVIDYLRRRGYRYLGISTEMRRRAAELMGDLVPEEFR